ncbi:hypothetical protein DZJ_50160 [Dickeya ananatis]
MADINSLPHTTMRTPAALPDAPVRVHNPLMVPLRPVSMRLRWTLGVGFFVLFIGLWSLVTFSGVVSATFLANPLTMLHEGVLLFTDYDFQQDIGMTVMRVVAGFLLAALIGVPLGILMGGLQAGGSLLRTVCVILPLSARLGVRTVADFVGRYR